MRKTIATITIAILATFAFADDITPQQAAWYTTQILGNSLNATTCPPAVQEIYATQNGNCYELDYTTTAAHRSLADYYLGQYNDLMPLAPWSAQDGNYYRLYRFEGMTLMFTVAKFRNGSVAGFVPLE